jgi:hypothetical protein
MHILYYRPVKSKMFIVPLTGMSTVLNRGSNQSGANKLAAFELAYDVC